MRNTAVRRVPEPFHSLLAGETRISRGGNGRIYRPNGMEGWVLNCTSSGRGRVNHETSPFTCSVGDLLLFPDGVVHDYDRAPGCSLWVHQWVQFVPRPTWTEWLAWPEVSEGVLRVAVSDTPTRQRILQRLRDVAGLFREPVPLRLDLCMNAIEEVLLLANTCLAVSRGHAADDRIHEAIDFMRDNYQQSTQVPALAARCALSPSRFAHLFREQTGVSPMRYLEQLRMARAKELLLTTNAAVAEVGYRCGYDNPLYFSHVFRRSVGRSPRSFREGRALAQRPEH
jgi:AraC family transcriptional regulator of arabinose operon